MGILWRWVTTTAGFQELSSTPPNEVYANFKRTIFMLDLMILQFTLCQLFHPLLLSEHTLLSQCTPLSPIQSTIFSPRAYVSFSPLPELTLPPQSFPGHTHLSELTQELWHSPPCPKNTQHTYVVLCTVTAVETWLLVSGYSALAFHSKLGIPWTMHACTQITYVS